MRNWFSKSRGIETAAYESWRASLPVRPDRVLTWTTTSDGLLVLSPALLSVLHRSSAHFATDPNQAGPADAARHDFEQAGAAAESASAGPAAVDGDWKHFGWHQIERGGWNNETGQLRWQTYAGKRGAVAVPEPGRIPEVFKERISASIMLEKFVPVIAESGRGVIIHARRNLADQPLPADSPYGGSVSWHATLTRGITWRTPGVRELADTTIQELQLEYAYS